MPQDRWISPTSTRLITLAIGGNDVGFGPILQNCSSTGFCDDTTYPQLDAEIQGMALQLRTVYTRLATEAPLARIIVLTYPQIFPPSYQGCSPTAVGKLTPPERDWIRSKWSEFNGVVKQTVATLGRPNVYVLDEENAFALHSVCDPQNWANGIEWLTINTSYHPNTMGDAKEGDDLVNALGQLP
jgi:hypothetical protein